MQISELCLEAGLKVEYGGEIVGVKCMSPMNTTSDLNASNTCSAFATARARVRAVGL